MHEGIGAVRLRCFSAENSLYTGLLACGGVACHLAETKAQDDLPVLVLMNEATERLIALVYNIVSLVLGAR